MYLGGGTVFLYFFSQIKSEDPETRCVAPSVLLQQVLLRYLVFQPSPLTYPVFFEKCNHFSNRAVQIHFMYSKALPRGSLLDCFKDLPAGNGFSVVIEGQCHCLQANPFQLLILQKAQCIQDPETPAEVWVGLL